MKENTEKIISVSLPCDRDSSFKKVFQSSALRIKIATKFVKFESLAFDMSQKWMELNFHSNGSINMRWLVYMKQTCRTSVEDVHKMTMDAVESSDNPALGAVKVEAIDSVAVTRTIGE